MISRWQRRGAQALVWVFRLAALASLLLWFMRRVQGSILDEVNIGDLFLAINVPVTASPVSVIVLTTIAVGLARKKRLAWAVVCLFQFLGAAAVIVNLTFYFKYIYLTDSADPNDLPELMWISIPPITAALLVAVPLWRLRRAFPAQLRRGALIWAASVSVVGFLVAIAAAHVLVTMWPGSAGPGWQQVCAVLLHALGFPIPEGWPDQFGRWIPQVTAGIMSVTAVAAIMLFFRAVHPRFQWTAEEEIALRKLLAAAGEDDSLGYFATRRDKLLHFSDNGKAAIAYRVVHGVALASGDPVGDRSAWNSVVGSWEANARRNGWLPAVLACSEVGAVVYSRVCQMDVLRLGDEAVLTQDRFVLDSPVLAGVKKAAKRARRAGWTTRISRVSGLGAEELEKLRAAANDWRVGRVERGFSMALGRFGDPSDSETVVAQVFGSDGNLIAFQSFVPWGGRGLSLDLMRRSPDAPNGTNEFLVAELMAWGANNGVSRVSLNFAFFRHVFAEAERVAAPKLAKANSRVLGMMDRFWQLQRLYRANAKYNPEWVPRYWALPTPLDAARVGVAMAIAEGFLPLVPVDPQTGSLSQADLDAIHELGQAPLPVLDGPKSNQARERYRRLTQLREAGQTGYPVGARKATWLRDLVAFDEEVVVAGRVRTIRDHGGICFVDLVDGEAKRQLLVDAGQVGRLAVRDFAHLVDSGDLIEVTCRSGQSRNGTDSLIVANWTVLAKALRPVPWWGLNDPQARSRNRSLDLLVHSDQLDLLKARSKVISAVRNTLTDSGFLEVETPILGLTNGGATARPFTTHINAYGTDLVLRIAPELSLKRLVVAGMDAIFEIGRNFRNEGADATHNPEFTVVEAYRALADYSDMRLLTQDLVQNAAVAVHGRAVLPLDVGSGAELVDVSGDWPVVSVCDAVSRATGRDISVAMESAELVEIAAAHGVELSDEDDIGKLIEELFDVLVAERTVLPTFFTDYPASTSPLTAPHRTDSGLSERWDLIIDGVELGTAYSELTDPLVQRQRLVEQSWRAARGDQEAMEIDEDFLSALELGMPPTGGLGIGLDRLAMAVTGTTIRQVLTFPFVRPSR